MNNKLLNMVEKRQIGIHSGVPSFCCANKIVIEAILDQAKRFDDTVVIESTSNQVNQFGGYMAMKPCDFRDYVYKIADQIKFDRNKIILGGDHLGPQPWQDLDEKEAMENSKELVRECVLAEYTKIHLDTSMRVKSDDHNVRLSDEIIAKRGVILYNAAEEAFKELQKTKPNAIHPVFVIGSEVPIPGGIQNDSEELKVTDINDFENTLLTYKRIFHEYKLDSAWDYIMAVVVQPGVEFGDGEIHKYDRQAAKALCNKLKEYPNIVFEGHSTDYQPPVLLREMVEDGIAILKVGPALTYALREGLFALSYMEKELITDEKKRANFIEVLEEEMLKNPKNWEKYYKGTENYKKIARKYSFSDRCRYYLSNANVDKAITKLFKNFDGLEIPLHMLHQYMPNQYIKVRDGLLKLDAKELVKDNIITLVDDYNYAVKTNYIISQIFVR